MGCSQARRWRRLSRAARPGTGLVGLLVGWDPLPARGLSACVRLRGGSPGRVERVRPSRDGPSRAPRKALRQLEEGEVFEVIEGPRTPELAGEHRARCKSLHGGHEGWFSATRILQRSPGVCSFAVMASDCTTTRSQEKEIVWVVWFEISATQVLRRQAHPGAVTAKTQTRMLLLVTSSAECPFEHRTKLYQHRCWPSRLVVSDYARIHCPALSVMQGCSLCHRFRLTKLLRHTPFSKAREADSLKHGHYLR